MPVNGYYFSRLALAGSIPGAASRMFKELVRATGATYVYAHTDNSYADGNVKALLGFKRVGVLPPRYRVWHRKYGPKHRIFWQKSSIPARIKELGMPVPENFSTLTTYAMHALCGCRHMWDHGKIRWEWRSDPVL